MLSELQVHGSPAVASSFYYHSHSISTDEWPLALAAPPWVQYRIAVPHIPT